jgi:hypothetical protein
MDETTILSERVERAALTELHGAASTELRDRLGLELESIGGATVSLAPGVPSNVINRTVGLGVGVPASEAAVKEITGRYARAGIDDYYIHVQPMAQPTELSEWLEDAGLVPRRGWMVFRRGMEPPPRLKSELEVRDVGPEHATDFGRIVAQAFDMGDGGAELVAGLVGRPGWHIGMTFDGDTPAGAGALFVRDGIGWGDWAATDPGFRRRGGQGIVLCHRIERAAELGCRLLFTETGEAVEGDPQHSYGNIVRTGFETVHVRANYGPEPADISSRTTTG